MNQPTTSTTSRKEWTRPYPDFPLSYHPPSGRLYKKIKSHRYYFGYASDPQAALDRYLAEKDDLYAGRRPRATQGALTVADLCERFMASRDALLQAGELSRLTFRNYLGTCRLVLAALGRNRAVEDLRPEDFRELRTKLSAGVSAVTAATRIGQARVLFNHAICDELIDGRIRYGNAFGKPTKDKIRKAKAEQGDRSFSREEVLALLAKVDVQWKAMILLGLNCGLGNNDVSSLRWRHLDLDGAWLDFPRPKTGIPRRAPLWPETVQALRDVQATPRKPAKGKDADLVFLTPNGAAWNRRVDTHSATFRRVLVAAGMLVHRRGFYALRHLCQTQGDGARDPVALQYIMGHTDGSTSATYRDSIEDSRLVQVAQHIRSWLFGVEGGAA